MSYEFRNKTFENAYEAGLRGDNGGFARVLAVWSYLPLTLSQRSMLTAVANIQEPGLPFDAGYRKLGKMAGMDPKTARRAIESLREFGFLTLHEKGGNGHASSYVFDAPMTTAKAIKFKEAHDLEAQEQRRERRKEADSYPRALRVV